MLVGAVAKFTKVIVVLSDNVKVVLPAEVELGAGVVPYPVNATWSLAVSPMT